MTSVRVAVVQTAPVLGRVADNIRRSLSLLEKETADVYVLPELAMTGYQFDSAEEARSLAEPAGAGPSFEALGAFARERGAYVAYGFPERGEGGIYNSAALLGPRGIVGVYRKTHLFNREKILFRPGDTGFRVFELPFGKVGMMICFDWFFPEAARALALAGARLILHPANLVLPHCPDAMITRCLENRVFAATADRVGAERGVTFIGTSEIVGPGGEVSVRLSRDAEEIGTALCDLTRADDKSLNERNDLFADRRPEFYRVSGSSERGPRGGVT